MSTTSGSKKSRKDIGFAANLAASIRTQKDDAEEAVEIVAPAQTDVMQQPGSSQSPEQAVIAEKQVPQNDEPQVPNDNQSAQLFSETVPDNQQPSIPSHQPEFVPVTETHEKELAQIRLVKKKARGIQKSMYLDHDVYQYILETAEKNQVYFSSLANYMLREYIKHIKSQGNKDEGEE